MKTTRIGHTLFGWGSQTYIMGILNLTPDSFSGDGLLQEPAEQNKIAAHAEDMIQAGADILDVGGESTRPGAQTVSEQDELARVLPAITAIRQVSNIPISIDTYKASVARAALEAGADMVNDVWGLGADPTMARLVAEHKAPVVLMHNRSNPANAELRAKLGGRYVGVQYENLIEDVRRELLEAVKRAHDAGVTDEQIILDPGIGFGKTVEQNLELVDRLDTLQTLGYPILLGPSRKSFIGYTLDVPPEERVEGTAATVSIGIARGADIVRVHDVAPIARVARMTDAIVRRRQA